MNKEVNIGPLNREVWSNAIVPIGSTIQQVIRNLDEVAVKIVMAVNESGELQGTISDGDIRRGLLRGLQLSSSIDSIMHRTPLVVTPEMGRETVLQLMVANKVQQIPVVDENYRVVGLHLWDEITTPPAKSNLVIIMAGGKGIRLRPHTENCPKPLLPVAGKPILEHIIERAKAEGFNRFLLTIHYLGDMIEKYFGDGERLQVEIKYLWEKSPLGTAGALGALEPRPSAPFLVTNGDVISDIRYSDLLDFHIRHRATATMAVRAHEWQHPYGVIQTDGVEIIGFEEKPIARTQINAGVYALDPEALVVLSKDEYCDMPALFERLKLTGKRTVAYPMHEPWLDVGRLDDLNHASDVVKSELRKE
jgi:dTDP-glucose pyrophosphorylase